MTYTHGQWNVVLPRGPWSPQSHLALCKSGRNNSGTYNVLKIRLLGGRVSSHTCLSRIQLDQKSWLSLTALNLIDCWCWRLLAIWVNQSNVDGTTIYPVVVTPICALLRAATDWGQSKKADCVTSVLSLWPSQNLLWLCVEYGGICQAPPMPTPHQHQWCTVIYYTLCLEFCQAILAFCFWTAWNVLR